MKPVVVWLACSLALVACKKQQAEEQPPPQKPVLSAEDTIAVTEAETGRQACAAYGELACECVLRFAELKEDCAMSKARVDALEMSLRAAMAEGNANNDDRRALVENSRKVIRACIEDTAKLVKKGCQDESQPAPSPPE